MNENELLWRYYLIPLKTPLKSMTKNLFHRPCLCYQLQFAINRVEHVCTTVSMVHSYMLMCNHKIVINIMLCLLYSTRHNAYRELYSTSSPKMSCEKGIL